jgi:hypothetical protein
MGAQKDCDKSFRGLTVIKRITAMILDLSRL